MVQMIADGSSDCMVNQMIADGSSDLKKSNPLYLNHGAKVRLFFETTKFWPVIRLDFQQVQAPFLVKKANS